jgi:hypothetical protein
MVIIIPAVRYRSVINKNTPVGQMAGDALKAR